MYENDFPVGNALRPSRTDVVLPEDVQHTRLRQTGDVRHRGQGQRQNGQYVVRVAGTPDGHPLELDAENEQQKRRHDETGHGGKKRHEEDDDTVRPLIPVQRRDGTQNDAEDERDQNGQQTDLGRNLERLSDGGGDVTPRLQRDTKISVEYVFEIVEELLTDRLVEAVAFIQDLHDRSRLRFFTVERSAGDRVHRKERDEADEEQGNERQRDTLDDILSHNDPPIFHKILMLLHYITLNKHNQSLTFDANRGRSGDLPRFSLYSSRNCVYNYCEVI